MPSLMVRNVDERLMAKLKQAARANHRSLAGEVRERLAASVAEPAFDKEAWLHDLQAIAKGTRPDPDGQPLADLVRDMRDEQADRAALP